MSNNNSSASGGIGFFGLLAILFITLKLYNVIAWPWYWVLAPIWGPLAFGLIVVAVFLICGCLAAVFGKKKRRRF